MNEPTTSISNCERTFTLKALEENIRLDGRLFDQYRELKIEYGTDWGLCMVSLGDTRVLAQVSGDVQAPKAGRPSEGLLYLNVEMSPMASIYFEGNHQSEVTVQINRILEKCYKESRCIDLESLCIVADEKVWNIRVDLNVLNYEGNLVGCCSIAALTALKHFRCPAVTMENGALIIHPVDERHPIPLTVRHFPLILSYALFDGEIIVEDPSLIEEKIADTILLLFINSYDEFCGMHLDGLALPSSFTILKCSKSGCTKSKKLVEIIKNSLEHDSDRRTGGKINGLVDSIASNFITEKVDNLKIQLKFDNMKNSAYTKPKKFVPMETENSKMSTNTNLSASIKELKKEVNLAAVGYKQKMVEFIKTNPSQEAAMTSDEDSNSDVEIIEVKNKKNVEIDSDQSEDEIMVLHPKDFE